MHIKSHIFSVEAEAGQAVFINSRIDDMGNWNSAIVCNITRAPPYGTYSTSKCVSSGETDSLTTWLLSHTPNLSTIS